MNESKAVVTNGWSCLNTIDEFDNGLSSMNSDAKEIFTTNKSISQTIAKSLFVESLIDQLCKLLEKDPIKRCKLYEGICSKLYEMQLIEDTYRIEELASLRSHFQQALLDVMIAPDARLPCFKLGSSRYATEYEEISFLASGGFGQVFKAKNRLDQVIYAVKKISLRYLNVQSFASKLNEVKTLAKLNHPNIVQYKAAWLEPILNLKQSVTPVEVKNLSGTDSDVVVFQNNQSLSGNNQVIEEENEQKNKALCKYQRCGRFQRPVPQMCALLYVTMQLCDQTLCEWLNNRNLYNHPVDVPLALNITLQVLAGVQYMHSCNIVHHDIKPRNIFLSNDLKSVQVGDFGLACCLQGHKGRDHSDCTLENGQFGTLLYAAPEQLKGNCDPKSDIFSLGLVLIELLTTFSTEMERVKILTKVRSGYLPPSIPLGLISIIKELVSHKSNSRPTASELLLKLQKLKSADLYESKAKSVAESKDDIMPESDDERERLELLVHKDREIVQLRRMLAQRDVEIAQLKNFINKNSS